MPRGHTQRVKELSIAGQELYFSYKIADRGYWDQNSVLHVTHKLPVPALNVGHNRREAMGHRLDQRDREPFRIGGQKEQVGVIKELMQYRSVDPAMQHDPSVRNFGFQLLTKIGQHRTVADDVQPILRQNAAQMLRQPDEVRGPLLNLCKPTSIEQA